MPIGFAAEAYADGAGDFALLGGVASATGAYSTFVLPGTYDLSYALYRSSGSALPINTNAHLGCFTVP